MNNEEAYKLLADSETLPMQHVAISKCLTLKKKLSNRSRGNLGE